MLLCLDFIKRQPVGCDYAMIKLLCGVMGMAVTGKAYSDEAGKVRIFSPKLYDNNVLRLKLPGGFFQYFTLGGVNQTLSFFKMSCRLIELKSAGGLFFYEQKTLVSFNNGGNCNVWFPNHYYIPIVKADILLDLDILCW
jgi:hypothetical protein